jgi:hypothetical protein
MYKMRSYPPYMSDVIPVYTVDRLNLFSPQVILIQRNFGSKFVNTTAELRVSRIRAPSRDLDARAARRS